jgi:hypothetical protein
MSELPFPIFYFFLFFIFSFSSSFLFLSPFFSSTSFLSIHPHILIHPPIPTPPAGRSRLPPPVAPPTRLLPSSALPVSSAAPAGRLRPAPTAVRRAAAAALSSRQVVGPRGPSPSLLCGADRFHATSSASAPPPPPPSCRWLLRQPRAPPEGISGKRRAEPSGATKSWLRLPFESREVLQGQLGQLHTWSRCKTYRLGGLRLEPLVEPSRSPPKQALSFIKMCSKLEVKI